MRMAAHNLSTQPARHGLLPSTLTIPAVLRATGMQQAWLILLRSVALTQLSKLPAAVSCTCAAQHA